MAYSEQVAERVRKALKGRHGVEEKRMFGGLTFLLRGHMCCGVLGDELIIRVGPRAYEEALSERHVRPMDFTGKPLRGFVYVDRPAFASDRQLAAWVAKGAEFALSLPAK